MKRDNIIRINRKLIIRVMFRMKRDSAHDKKRNRRIVIQYFISRRKKFIYFL